jgi:CheY-like chemotaxis protein
MKRIKGEIILVDDEVYEKEFLDISLHQLGYKVSVKYFSDAANAIRYLRDSEIPVFLIISDLHMPGLNGIHFKQILDEDEQLKMKTIPFVFATSAASRELIVDAYKHNIQGFFRKPPGLNELKKYLAVIVQYWMINLHPNKWEMVIETEQEEIED